MQIVAEARSRGYNVNLAMMEADLTLTGAREGGSSLCAEAALLREVVLCCMPAAAAAISHHEMPQP